VIDVTGNGDGNAYMFLDNFLIANSTGSQPAFHYSPSNCNTPPVAGDNTYNPTSNTAAYKGASVLDNDSDPNGESFAITSYTQPAGTGSVVLNADGTFTFTPRTDTTFTYTSFTYTITDNGYERLSTTATVYLYFPQVTSLPLHLLQFSGTTGTKTVLAWRVASNQDGSHFEVQRNTGSAYQTIAVVFTTEKSGEEAYQFTDVTASGPCRYRLKMVNKDGSATFSNVLTLDATINQKILLLQNPVQNTLRFALDKPAGIKQVTVYNNGGTVVYMGKADVAKSNNTISIALASNLPRGIYFLEVVTTSGIKTTQFLKQ